MKKNNTVYEFDNQGNLQSSVMKFVRALDDRPASIWENKVFSYIVVIGLMIFDFMFIFQLFDSVLYDSLLLKIGAIFGALVVYEIFPIYVSRTYKEKVQGYPVMKWMVYALLIAFGCAVILNLSLRIYYRELSFPNFSQVNILMNGSEQQGEAGTSAMLLALFFGLFPVFTSMLSGYISYVGYNPLKEEIARLQDSYDIISDESCKVESILSEYEADSNYKERLLADDQSKYEAILEMIRKMNYEYKDYSRQLLKEIILTAEGNNFLSHNPKDEES